MIYILISIKDRAVNAYEPIANVRAEGEALRVFHDLISNTETKYARHPSDYDLYKIGYFNDQTGELSSIDAGIQKIADGKSVKEMQQQ